MTKGGVSQEGAHFREWEAWWVCLGGGKGLDVDVDRGWAEVGEGVGGKGVGHEPSDQ